MVVNWCKRVNGKCRSQSNTTELLKVCGLLSIEILALNHTLVPGLPALLGNTRCIHNWDLWLCIAVLLQHNAKKYVMSLCEDHLSEIFLRSIKKKNYSHAVSAWIMFQFTGQFLPNPKEGRCFRNNKLLPSSTKQQLVRRYIQISIFIDGKTDKSTAITQFVWQDT